MGAFVGGFAIAFFVVVAFAFVLATAFAFAWAIWFEGPMTKASNV